MAKIPKRSPSIAFSLAASSDVSTNEPKGCKRHTEEYGDESESKRTRLFVEEQRLVGEAEHRFIKERLNCQCQQLWEPIKPKKNILSS